MRSAERGGKAVNRRSARRTLLFAVLSMLLVVALLGSVTYAWFTFNTSTNVLPMRGGVSGGDGDLTISTSPDGPFDVTCDLLPAALAEALDPVSTADLNSFYTSAMQDTQGITQLYKTEDDPDARMIRGTIYLRSSQSACSVYLWGPGLDFGSDVQALAALRLGLRFTTAAGVTTHIFRLDDVADTSAAAARRTVALPGAVVSSVDAAGRAQLVGDVSEPLHAYYAKGTEEETLPGENALGVLGTDEVGRVDYWLYLEGCDDNCFNPVQSRDVALQLAFAGV